METTDKRECPKCKSKNIIYAGLKTLVDAVKIDDKRLIQNHNQFMNVRIVKNYLFFMKGRFKKVFLSCIVAIFSLFSTLPSQKESPKDYIDKKLPPLVVKEHHLNHQDSSRRVDEEIRLAN
ncbi:MAG: hypothetical protein Q7K54_01435, partial [Candidatus Parcubacteria bacterium]|nr:hypothetical protein [Candidatus Parcubacteria bacterium]